MPIRKVTWSPVEEDYLRKNRTKPLNQLCIALAKTRYSVNKKLKDMELAKQGLKPNTKKKLRGRSRIGKRKDCDNQFFRSAWEANVYRLFKADPNVKLIEYEPTTFSFAPPGIIRGTVSYTPDFRVTFKDGTQIWVEVKGGFMRDSDKTKIRRFKKYYPEEYKKLVAIAPGPKAKTSLFFKEMGIDIRWHYPDLKKNYRKTIPNWED